MKHRLYGWFGNAGFGLLIWLGLVFLPINPNYGMGTIETLFLLAPLVIVPLGFGLVDRENIAGIGLGLPKYLRIFQPTAAVLMVASFFFEPSKFAGVLVVPWVGITLAVGVKAFLWLLRGGYRARVPFCYAIALLFLPVGGIGLLQSRLGISALGYFEPVILLVAVHFHYAAFVSPLMVGAVGVALINPPKILQRLHLLIAIAVCAGSPMLAMGYILFVPWIRLLAASLLVVGLFALLLLSLALLPGIRPRIGQVLLGISAISVVAAMLYAVVYAVADYWDIQWISIPHIARTHGYLNGLGFSLCGLLGWNLVRIVQHKKTSELTPQRDQLRTLTRRWEP